MAPVRSLVRPLLLYVTGRVRVVTPRARFQILEEAQSTHLLLVSVCCIRGLMHDFCKRFFLSFFR